MFSQIGRYVGLFGAMLVEGPMVTIGAATASHFGHFDVYVVFVLSVLGDFGADAIYFSIGRASRYGRMQKVWRYLRRQSGYEYWQWFQEKIQHHSVAGIAVIKLTPAAPGPGLAATGAAGVPLRTFMLASLLVAVPKSAVLVAIGYFFGYALHAIQRSFHIGFLILVTALPAAILGYLVYRSIKRHWRHA